MKAIIIKNYGTPEDLHFEEVATPVPAAGQVLVKIYAAAVNFVDIGKAMGGFKDQFELPFPWIPGIDFAGVVESTGSEVQDFKAGDEVYGASLQGGAFAEFIAVKTNVIALKPASLDFIEAASVPVSAETAWQALFGHGQPVKGQTVLIHGGAGAVGAYAVQFAHQAGARVMVTATAHDTTYLQSLGADVIIDRNTTAFESVVTGADLVIDFVGKDVHQRSYQVIKEEGYLITTNEPPSAEMAARYKINTLFFQLQPSGTGLAGIAGHIDSGKLKINLAAVYPLQNAATAWNDLMGKTGKKKKNGRIVLQVI